MGKNIILTEEQFDTYIVLNILEGLNKPTMINGVPSYSINTSTLDKDNIAADTRIFGTANDILYGDNNTKSIISNDKTRNFSNRYNKLSGKISKIKRALDFVMNEYNDNEGVKSLLDGIYSVTYNDEDILQSIERQIQNAEEEGVNVREWIISYLEKEIDRIGMSYDMYSDKYNRITSVKNSQKIERYNIGKVPGTNIDVIALFAMNDFNFSDILKNGALRQNIKTDKILGIKKSEREKIPSVYGNRQFAKIPVTYDNGITPNIQGNFSLSDELLYDRDDEKNLDHFKTQYSYQDSNYHSIAQFIDKSVMYAAYVLKKINYTPDIILSAPSSSKFNEYYCTNLSRKLSIPYVKDFFKRNVINITFDEITEQSLDRVGAKEEDKIKIKNSITNAIYGEISAEIKEKIGEFFQLNFEILTNISKESHSRLKISPELLTSILCTDICSELLSSPKLLNETMIYKNIARRFINGETGVINKRNIEIKRAREELGKAIKLKIGIKQFKALLQQVNQIMKDYDKYIKNGFTFNAKKFKITDIERRFRNCLNNVYVISDKYLNKQNNDIQRQYKNSKFLIFDEDINSGATLKLVSDVLQDKIDNDYRKIKCLVNAYSSSGR